jgi:hypothetical protein
MSTPSVLFVCVRNSGKSGDVGGRAELAWLAV